MPTKKKPAKKPEPAAPTETPDGRGVTFTRVRAAQVYQPAAPLRAVLVTAYRALDGVGVVTARYDVPVLGIQATVEDTYSGPTVPWGASGPVPKTNTEPHIFEAGFRLDDLEFTEPVKHRVLLWDQASQEPSTMYSYANAETVIAPRDLPHDDWERLLKGTEQELKDRFAGRGALPSESQLRAAQARAAEIARS